MRRRVPRGSPGNQPTSAPWDGARSQAVQRSDDRQFLDGTSASGPNCSLEHWTWRSRSGTRTGRRCDQSVGHDLGVGHEDFSRADLNECRRESVEVHVHRTRASTTRHDVPGVGRSSRSVRAPTAKDVTPICVAISRLASALRSSRGKSRRLLRACPASVDHRAGDTERHVPPAESPATVMWFAL